MPIKTPQTSAGAEGCKPSRTPSTPRETPRPPAAKSPATPTPARADAPPPPADLPGTLPPPAGGVGKMDAGAGVGAGTLIGGVAQGRGPSSPTSSPTSSASRRLRVGMRVRNASGRGVWGFGSIVGVVPAGTHPRWYCRRHSLPMVFGERCAPVWRDRCIVLGDDGRYHSPRNVEVCDGR